jgi:CheY-like chemotaxis protein
MAQTPPPPPRATVLIVETHTIVRLEPASWLEEAGFGVLLASDADAAIALLNAHADIALLVTNIKMPGSIDGLRLAHHVRDRWPPIKIIVTSGLPIDRRQLPLGSLFLAKPYEPKTLGKALFAHRLGRTAHSAAG